MVRAASASEGSSPAAVWRSAVSRWSVAAAKSSAISAAPDPTPANSTRPTASPSTRRAASTSTRTAAGALRSSSWSAGEVTRRGPSRGRPREVVYRRRRPREGVIIQRVRAAARRAAAAGALRGSRRPAVEQVENVELTQPRPERLGPRGDQRDIGAVQVEPSRWSAQELADPPCVPARPLRENRQALAFHEGPRRLHEPGGSPSSRAEARAGTVYRPQRP